MNPNVINNPVYEKPVDVNINLLGDTGKILYCNGFGGLNKIENLPTEMLEALNTENISGSTILMQLKTLFNNKVADGPWYIDLINGVIFIHNRNWTDPVLENYTYYQEHGEVIRVDLSLQSKYQGKNRVLSSTHYNPINNIIEKIAASDPELPPKITSDDGQTQDPDAPKLDINHVELNDATSTNRSILSRTNPEAAAISSNYNIQKSTLQKYSEEVDKEEHDRKLNDWFSGQQQLQKATSKKTRSSEAASAYVQDTSLSADTAAVKVVQIALKTQTPIREVRVSDVQQYWKSCYYRAARSGAKDVAAEAVRLFKLKIREIYGLEIGSLTATVHLQGEAVKKGPLVRQVYHVDSNVVSQGYEAIGDYVRQKYGAEFDAYFIGQVPYNGGTLWFGNKQTGVAQNSNGYYVIGWKRTYTKEGTVVQYTDILGAACEQDPTTQLIENQNILMANQKALQNQINGIKNYLKKSREKELTANMDVVGRPSLVAARYINVYNISNAKLDGNHPLSGKWYVKQCTHTFTPDGGYITSLSMVKR